MTEMSQVEGTPETSSQANAPKDSRPLYEIGFHVLPTLDESEVGGVVAALRAEVKKAGGEITTEQAPQKMVLAYTVERATTGKREKYNESYFGWLQFVVEERTGINGIEDFLKQNKNVLRYLFIKTIPHETQAQRRAVFSSNRLAGETLKKPAPVAEVPIAEVSEEELNKSLDALVN